MTSGPSSSVLGPRRASALEDVGRYGQRRAQHGDAVGPRGMRARTAAGDTGAELRDASDHAAAERAELADERGLGVPAHDPVVEDERDASPAQVAVGVGRQPGDPLAGVRRDAVDVRRRPLQRHLARAVGGGDEDDVRVAAGEVAQRDPVHREGPARDHDVDVLALDELAGDLRERGELARLAAAAHDLDAPPGHAHAVHAVARVPAGACGRRAR